MAPDFPFVVQSATIGMLNMNNPFCMGIKHLFRSKEMPGKNPLKASSQHSLEL